MREIPGRAWVLVLVSALLQIAIFPIAGPAPMWRAALCWIALAPLFIGLFEKDQTGRVLGVKRSALLGYGCGSLWYMGNCYWIYPTMHTFGGIPQPVAFLILVFFSLYLGLYHALFAAAVGWLAKKLRPRTVLTLVPFLWVAVEMARGRITSFPWDLLGYAQVDNLFVTSLAPITGVMGVSFLIAAVNAAFAMLSMEAGRRRRYAGAGIVIAVALLVGLGLELPVTPASQPYSYAVMMQENIEVGVAATSLPRLNPAQEVEQFASWSLHPLIESAPNQPQSEWLPAKSQPRTNVLVWPEAPSHFVSSDAGFRNSMAQLARAAAAPLIIGSLGVDYSNASPKGYLEYDSATSFDSTGAYAGRYDKIHLVPWGEYVPYKQVFSFAQKLTEGVGDMDRGTARRVLRLDGHSYGTMICYESVFGDEVREFVNNGAEVLVNISNDGWYGDSSAPWQTLNMARMRAIENRRWVLRSTNTGITAAIDPRGRVGQAAPRHVRAAFVFPFEFAKSDERTLYTRYGDWFGWVCVLVTLSGLLAAGTKKASAASVRA